MLTPQPLDLPPTCSPWRPNLIQRFAMPARSLPQISKSSGQPMNQPKTVITTTLTWHIIPETWPEARLPSPYSFEDLPGILNQPQEYLTPAAPSSIYTRSFLLGHSPAQLSCNTYETMAVTSCWSHDADFNAPLGSQIFRSRVPTGRLSTPNISSFYRQGISRSQLLYHQVPASQPIISHRLSAPSLVRLLGAKRASSWWRWF